MTVVEIFLASFLKVLLNRLAGDFLKFARQEGVDKKLMKWRETLSAIEVVLHDAEEKQLTSEAVKLWLDDLKDLAYDVEDILDKFSTEMLHRKVDEEQYGAMTSKVRSLLPKVKLNFTMKSEIKQITSRLKDISARKEEIGLNCIGDTSSKVWNRPPSSCVLGGLHVVGRDADKAKIVEFLSRDEPGSANFQVAAVVGMPGIGKTTLAQFVFSHNNEALKQFKVKVWVSVSDDFDIVRVTKAILESVTSQPCKLKEFSNIQDDLSEELASKKFLIILDDVWNTCDYGLWTTLQTPFHVGAAGSKIIVTTRDAEVARTMRASEVHNLEYISNDDCWRVFQQHALLNVNSIPLVQNPELLREKIVAKCGGLPLAARTLGGLLGCKEICQWGEILNNKLWSLADKSNILPVLKLSYHYLPSNLKRCFAYCSILPNNYEFGDKELILLWMAEGLIQQQEETKHLEDLGSDYFQDLVSRSLFQNSSKNNSRYVMHDLVNELARSVAGETCFRLEDMMGGSMQFPSQKKARHSSYLCSTHDGVKKFEAFYEVKHLRTFLPLTLSLSYHRWYNLTSKVTLDLLPKLQYLRVLSLNGYQITELPDSISDLKHLRYLDLSHTLISSFPQSMSTLYNLQTLILENCSWLKALPASMKNLTNLRHLNNSNVPLLEGMPGQLGRLTNLQTLSNFVVGKGKESGLGQIGPLRHLRGTLRLSRLENVKSVEDVKRANLISKGGLDELLLECSYGTYMESDVLDMLQPHRMLRVLTIRNYGDLKFSAWVGDSLFSNMVLVRLEDCFLCELLPPLGQLPSLRKLYIRNMSGVYSVGPEFYGEGRQPFPLLETLEFHDMQSWTKWSAWEKDQENGVFPCLKMLCISGCPRLEGRLPETLDLLSELVIRGCEQLVVSIANYKKVQKLDIHDCKRVVHDSSVEFELLEAVELSSISEFTLQSDEFLRGLTKLKDLCINGCEKLTSLWQNEDRLLQCLISLPRLVIKNNSNLFKLHHLISLQELHIYKCNSHLVQLDHLRFLEELHIYQCPTLISFQEVGLPHSLRNIKIEWCESLAYFARFQVPPSLRRMEIFKCFNLKSLLEVEEAVEGSSSSSFGTQEEASGLEYLRIVGCNSLTSLSFRDHLPRTLKHLLVESCQQLESIVGSFNNYSSLEEVDISGCLKLKSFPEGLSNLGNLQSLSVRYCGSLVSFPRGGFSSSSISNLRKIEIDCYNLKALPQGVHRLYSLQILKIHYCEGFMPFLEEGLPSNLIQLQVQGLKSCKQLLEWGLYRLTSLRKLVITGTDPELVSFPPGNNMVLPESLIELSIEDFPNLIELSNGFQFLTSLESLAIQKCRKLKFMPEEGLPLSLRQLLINGCPPLQKKCERSGAYWRSIVHIPFIKIAYSSDKFSYFSGPDSDTE